MTRTLRAGAVQLHAVLGDVEANVAAVEPAVAAAAADGAEVVALPEFFTTGVAYSALVAAGAQPVDGWVTDALTAWAARHDVLISGSLLVRDPDGHVRNAQLLVGPGGVIGRHDKDLPTMWENALYTGGHDDGLVHAPADSTTRVAEPLDVGLAVCWELTRSRTVRRLAGRVDLVLAGSGWWSVPRWWPGPVFDRWERANAERARGAAGGFARLVGAPVVHAAHVGDLECALPGQPGRYRGHLEGGTGAWRADGSLVAMLPPESTGPGTARQITLDVPLERRTPPSTPDDYWLTPPGPMPTFAWHWQRWWGRRFYEAHVRSTSA